MGVVIIMCSLKDQDFFSFMSRLSVFGVEDESGEQDDNHLLLVCKLTNVFTIGSAPVEFDINTGREAHFKNKGFVLGSSQ